MNAIRKAEQLNIEENINIYLTNYGDSCISKSQNPVRYKENKNISSMLEVYLEINYLKELYRQGWLKRGISKEKCESVAEHVFGVAMLSLFIAENEFPQLDIMKVLKMALLHEIGEIYGGDITPDQNVCDEEKHKIEAASVEKVLGKLENGQKYIDIWHEFEEGKTKEAKFVRQIDKLECGMQSVIYDKRDYSGMNEFFEYTLDRLELDKLIKLMNETISL